jgi:hypothetical protein
VRFPPRNKIPTARERDERLRKGHSEAPVLRDASPGAMLVNVHLSFLPANEPPHAEQSFALYPAARAFFVYPCPYGDCDGVYDLSAEAARTLGREKSNVTGVVECGGTRSRDGLQGQPCGLRVSYTISAKHENEQQSGAGEQPPLAAD